MSMLMNIPQNFTPALLRLMMELGHGEELLICDANYPYRSTGCREEDLIHITGCSIPQLLEDVLRFFPLDQRVESAAVVMESAKESDTFDTYQRVLQSSPTTTALRVVSRFDFYEMAHSAVGVVITSDAIKGGNILLKKGVVRNEHA